MKRYPIKNIDPQTLAPSVPPSSEAPESTFDVEKLLGSAAAILSREIRNLMFESSQGKLQPSSAKALVDYIKLLEEISQKQKEDLANLTDEELAVIAKNSNNSGQD